MRWWSMLWMVGLAGCGLGGLDAKFDDEFSLLLRPLGGFLVPGDFMHNPYVVGTDVDITVHARRDLAGLTVESADPAVFVVDAVTEDEGVLQVEATAVGEGETELLLVDANGRVLDSTVVQAKVPEAIELHAAGPLRAGMHEGFTRRDQPALQVGGLATFEVRYLADGEQLYGYGGLEVRAPEAVNAEVEQTWLGKRREWLQVTVDDVGLHPVELAVDGATLHADFRGVSEEQIVRIGAWAEAVTPVEQEQVVVAGLAFDADDALVTGVTFDWFLDGQAEGGEGDLYVYEHVPGADAELELELDGLTAGLTIHGDGQVTSSNDLGCAIARPTTLGLLWAIPMLGWTRRRKSSR